MRPLQRIIQHTSSVMLDVLFPRLCAGCQREGEFVCEDCISILPAWEDGLCAWCSSIGNESNSCNLCAQQRGIEGIWIGYRYDNRVAARLVHALKFQYQERVGEVMGMLLARRLAVRLPYIEMIVPIPLDAARMKERGFNQSWYFAHHISMQCGIVMNETILCRTTSRAPQATLDAVTRETNVRGVYATALNNHIPHSVLLVDDVTTTGATLREAAAVLRDAGVVRIYAAVFAHGTPPTISSQKEVLLGR